MELGVVVLGEAAGLQALAPEGLDDPDAGDALLQGRHGLADAVPHRQIGRVRLAAEPAGGDHQGRQGHQADQEQQRAVHDEHDDGDHEQQTVGDELDQAHLDEVLEGVDVGGHAGHQPPGLLPVEEGHGHALDVAEDADPQAPQELLAHPAHQHDLGPAQHQGGDGHGQVGQGDAVQGPPAAVLAQAVVDAVTDEAGAGQGGQGEQDHDRQGGDDQGAVGPQHAQGAPEDLARLLPAEAVLLVEGDVAPPAHG